MISVVIPVKDGGADLVRCLEAISRQRTEEDVEVVVVDSGSRDGSAARARSFGARVHEIPAEEFHHGRTRNLGADMAHGDTLVFTSQDAYAADDSWLSRLTTPIAQDGIAGAYGRQIESSEDAAKLEALEKAGLLKRIPFEGREEMKARVDPVMAAYAEKIGVAEIYEQINAIE